MNWKIIIAAYILLINVVAFAAMGVDKRRAKRGAWRISEATLFLLAALGGSPGTLLGMKNFHHKTKHKRFTLGIPLILLLQCGLLLWLFTGGFFAPGQ